MKSIHLPLALLALALPACDSPGTSERSAAVDNDRGQGDANPGVPSVSGDDDGRDDDGRDDDGRDDDGRDDDGDDDGGDDGCEGGGPEMPFPVCGDVELHVVGLIDAYDSATGEEGVAHVHIDRPGTVRLFLSAYSAVTWNITVGPQTELVDVIVHGYEVQTVIAPDAELPTGTFSFEGDGLFLGCGFEYPDTDEFDGCETDELLQQISGLLERPIASYHGCYAGSEFNIAADLSSTSNCATDMGYSLTSASFCEE